MTDKHVAAVTAFVEEDGQNAFKYIAKCLGILNGSVRKILTKNLGIRKICTRTCAFVHDTFVIK